MSQLLRHLRLEGRDLIECVLLPGLAAVLPWRLCFVLFRRMSLWKFLYRADCERALAQAQARGWVGDPGPWLAARRLTTLIDHADQYLAVSRSDAWMRKFLKVDGEWPAPGHPAVLCTFHWGAGMWALRHAATKGLLAHMMVAQPKPAGFRGRWVFYRYIVARTASIARSLHRPTVDAAASLRLALKALRANEQVMAVVDVPADQVVASQAIRLVGMSARVPRALFRLAVEQRLPVTVFLTGIDMTNGDRFLRIRQFGVYDDIDALILDVFLQLDAAIVENPPAWHFWGESERFFRDTDTSVPR